MAVILIVSKEDSIKLDAVGATGSWETGYLKNYLHFTDAGVSYSSCCEVGSDCMWIDPVLKSPAIGSSGYNEIQNSILDMEKKKQSKWF